MCDLKIVLILNKLSPKLLFSLGETLFIVKVNILNLGFFNEVDFL